MTVIDWITRAVRSSRISHNCGMAVDRPARFACEALHFEGRRIARGPNNGEVYGSTLPEGKHCVQPRSMQYRLKVELGDEIGIV